MPPIQDTNRSGRLWIRQVATQNRVRLPREVSKYIAGLEPEDGRKLDFLGRIGPFGQLHLVLQDPCADAAHELDSAFARVPPKAADISSKGLELARFFATSWLVPCSFESAGNRFTFVLPKEARDLGVLPNEGGVIAIFSAGQILEFWTAHAWVQHVSKSASNLGDLTRLALAEINGEQPE